MRYKNSKILIFYVVLAFFCTYYVLGIENLSFINSSWLAAHDVTTDLVSWKFFKNDIWRFPIGKNPNFGMDIGSGIVFTGSIPILAVFFKLFSSVLPDNFHYFSFWIFICFFLQSYVAFLIIYNNSKNLLFSIIGSLFFLLSPTLINRLGLHLSLCAHWLILLGFYIHTKDNLSNKNIYWAILISLSALIHFYFTIILLGVFYLFFFSKLKKNFSYKKLFIQTFFIIGSLVFTMFVFGYFEVPFTDALGFGYGQYQMDIAGIIIPNTSTTISHIDWSFFLPEMTGVGQEGFVYIGFGGILLLILGTVIFFSNFKKIINKEDLISYLLIIIIFSSIALTNDISVFGNRILNFELPKVFYGLLSIVRASGRLFWPVYYLIFLGSILIICKKFSKKNSVYVLLLLLFFQIVDIYPGLNKHYNSRAFISEKKIINYSFWNNLTKKNSILRTTYLNNETHFLSSLREILLLKNIKSTDISTHGRYNRKLASISRSNLYKSFNQYQMKKNIIFAIDNKNHLRNLKYLFKNKDVGFFLRDDSWFAVSGYNKQMTQYDKEELEKYEPITLPKSNKIYLNFSDENSIQGFGWTHNYHSKANGIWTEGNIANLLFKLNKNISKNFIILIKLNSLITKKNDVINFDIDVNNLFSKKFNLKNITDLKDNSIFINVDKDLIEEDIVYIKFKIKNPVTQLELLKSPDARQLGLLIESLEIINL